MPVEEIPQITVRPEGVLPPPGPPPGLEDVAPDAAGVDQVPMPTRAPAEIRPAATTAPAAVGDTAPPQDLKPWWSEIATPEDPTKKAEPTPSTHPGGKPWWSDIAQTEKTEPERPEGEIGKGESVARGFEHGLSMGAAPALHGLGEVSQIPTKQLEKAFGIPEGSVKLPAHIRAIQGAAEMLGNFFAGHKDPEAAEAYKRGREAALNKEKLAADQHPAYYLGGNLAGAVSIPGLGAMRAAGVGGRAAQGAIQGGVVGGLTGAGEAVSEDKPIAEVGKSAGKGAAIGAPLGAAVGAAVGPRLARSGTGERAARTAEELGAPLPRGYATDSRMLQQATNKARGVPLAGDAIIHNVEETGRAAGRRVNEIAETKFGGPPERAVADAAVRPALRDVVDTNRGDIDALYNGLRGQIDAETRRFTMPRTDAALTRIMRERQAAGHTDPAQGLEQFRNVAGGATFNGAHRARVDARNAGNVMNPHPGYNAADFNQLTRAMGADLREMAQAAANNQTPAGRAAALRAFEEAERAFGPLADQNRFLTRLAESQGEGAIGRLLGASREASGNVRLLAQMRQAMDPAEFERIGSLVLYEAGHAPHLGDFSLAKFTTEWGKVSEGAKRALFSPDHVRNLDDIAAMGAHLKRATVGASTSHSAGPFIALEVLKDVVMVGAGIAHGEVGTAGAVAAATTGGAYALARFLAQPAGAASAGAFTRAYRAVTLGQPTPARLATFKIATGNLANQLGVPVEKVMERITARLSAGADSDSGDKGAEKQ